MEALPWTSDGVSAGAVAAGVKYADADRRREPGIEMAVDAHRVCQGDDVLHPLYLADLDRGNVARVEDRRASRDVAHSTVVEVVRRVTVEVRQAVVKDRRPRDLVIAQSRLVDVRLERRTGLTLGQHHVEL